jgi:hypothetical protein
MLQQFEFIVSARWTASTMINCDRTEMQETGPAAGTEPRQHRRGPATVAVEPRRARTAAQSPIKAPLRRTAHSSTSTLPRPRAYSRSLAMDGRATIEGIDDQPAIRRKEVSITRPRAERMNIKNAAQSGNREIAM